MVARRQVTQGAADRLRVSDLILKAAILAGLVFLLPLALACRLVEHRYRSARQSSGFGRHRRNVAVLRLRRMRVYLHFSGLSDFAGFLLSGQDVGPLVRSYQGSLAPKASWSRTRSIA